MLLTGCLLFYPISFTNEYHSIQAPYLFEDLPVFGIIFVVWFIVLFWLIFSRRDNPYLNAENLLLCAVFGLVFMGFWVVITPYGSYADDIYNMGHVRYVLEAATIGVGHSNLGYFDFPGMHLMTAVIAQVSGLDIFTSCLVFLLFNIVSFSFLIYILLIKTLRSNYLAVGGYIFLVMSDLLLVEKMHIFTPGAFGFTLLAGLLVWLQLSEKSLLDTTVSQRLMLIILALAMVISYFATSLLAPLIFAGIYGLQLAGRDRTASISLTNTILFLTLVLAWEVYWTWHTFDSLSSFWPRIMEDLVNGEFLTSMLTLSSSAAGSGLPLWARVTRYFWWGLLGLGSILGMLNLLKIKRSGLAEKIETGGILGIAALTVLGTFGTSGGIQFTRYLMYAPLFCVPILLRFFNNLGSWGRRSLAGLAGLMLVFALPTFLSSVNTIATDAVHAYDAAAGQFLEGNYNEPGEDIAVYRPSTVTAASIFYYVPDTKMKTISEKAYFDEDLFRKKLVELTVSFQNPQALTDYHKILVVDEKMTVHPQQLLGILKDDPVWDDLETSLAAANLFYHNGHVRMYYP
jgi:hypothetical protein